MSEELCGWSPPWKRGTKSSWFRAMKYSREHGQIHAQEKCAVYRISPRQVTFSSLIYSQQLQNTISSEKLTGGGGLLFPDGPRQTSPSLLPCLIWFSFFIRISTGNVYATRPSRVSFTYIKQECDRRSRKLIEFRRVLTYTRFCPWQYFKVHCHSAYRLLKTKEECQGRREPTEVTAKWDLRWRIKRQVRPPLLTRFRSCRTSVGTRLSLLCATRVVILQRRPGDAGKLPRKRRRPRDSRRTGGAGPAILTRDTYESDLLASMTQSSH